MTHMGPEGLQPSWERGLLVNSAIPTSSEHFRRRLAVQACHRRCSNFARLSRALGQLASSSCSALLFALFCSWQCTCAGMEEAPAAVEPPLIGSSNDPESLPAPPEGCFGSRLNKKFRVTEPRSVNAVTHKVRHTYQYMQLASNLQEYA